MTDKELQIQKSQHIMSDTIDKMVIVIHIITGAYYSLTEAGAELWQKINDGQKKFNADEIQKIKAFAKEELLIVENSLDDYMEIAFEEVGMKFTDMEEMLMGDPIHEVDSQGWPSLKKDESS